MWRRAYRLAGDIGRLEGRLGAVCDEYGRGLELLKRHRCPLVEWKLLRAAAAAAREFGQHDQASALESRCEAVLGGLKQSITSERLRKAFTVAV